MKIVQIIVVISVLNLAVCRCWAEPDPTPEYTPKQLLDKFMSLEVSSLKQFIEEYGNKEDHEAQFDLMLELLNQKDEAQLLDLIARGFANGWPVDFVDRLFGRSFMHTLGKHPPDADRVCFQITDPSIHAGCKWFIIQAAQRNWAKEWNEAAWLRFADLVAKYVSATNLTSEFRSPVVDDLLRSANKRLSGGLSQNAKSHIHNTVSLFVLSALDNAKDNKAAEYTLVRDALRGFSIMRSCGNQEDQAVQTALTNVVGILMRTNTSVYTMREILRARDYLSLEATLTPKDVLSLKKDQRLAEPADQAMLDGLFQKVTERGSSE